MTAVARSIIVIAALLPLWLWPRAGAQDCKGMPPGPAKRQCVVQNQPEVLEAKKERCKALAIERDAGRGTLKDFMQSCMQGKVSR